MNNSRLILPFKEFLDFGSNKLNTTVKMNKINKM